ncbi:8149_t:CDS:2 [Rhizophagus irregularis]|nr:8149_t:CDS:2 [Rhizophagus irregularis]
MSIYSMLISLCYVAIEQMQSYHLLVVAGNNGLDNECIIQRAHVDDIRGQYL